MSQKSAAIQGFFDIFFEKRCLYCRKKGRRLLCEVCLKELRLDRGEGRRAYLFELSDVAAALVQSPLDIAQKTVAAYVNVRLDQLGWSVGHVIARCEELEDLAALIFTHGASATLAIDLESGRLTLDLIE